jgi:hypothetical protein
VNPASTSILAEVRANAYYDRSDTSYVVDPAGTSILSEVHADLYVDRTDRDFSLDPGGTSVLYDLDVRGTIYDRAGSYVEIGDAILSRRLVDEDDSAYYVDPASTSVLDEVRAGAYYDHDDTSYYVDPAGRSILSGVLADNFAVGSTSIFAGLRVQDTATNDIDYGIEVVSADVYGVLAQGVTAGAYFEDSDSGTFTRVAWGDYGIDTNGDISTLGDIYGENIYGENKHFVQPHPTDPDTVIVYVTLEGGEAGTYFRGSGRLQEGVAVIELPEHFGLVTVDEGLTAQVTPRDDCNGLYVAEVTPTRIVVKELQGGTSDARFDFLVFGLRAGYEDHQVFRDASEFPFLAGKTAASDED